MNARLARTITVLYPRRWRRRYGDEFVELLQALPATPAVIVDATVGAARLRARDVAVVTGAIACVALLSASAVRSSAPPAPAHAYSFVRPAASACRTYSSVSTSEHVSADRCLD